MHGLYQDQGERLMIAQTHMQTDMDMDMGACIYMGLGPSRYRSIKSSSSDGP